MAKTKIKTGGITDLNVTVAKLPAAVDISTKTVTLPASVSGLGTGITASQLTNTLDLSSHTVTLPASAISYPTFTSTTPSTVTNDLTSLVIVGTNFGSSGIPAVEFQNSTGVITAASSVVRDSATQLTVGCTLPTDGTYFIRIELNTGLAVRSTTAVLTVSDAPVWTTESGSIGTIAGDFSGTVATVAATGDGVEFTETTDVLENAALANCTLASATGIITTTDFGGSSTEATTYTFTIRATDDQAQTADREFTLTSSFGATGGGQFNQDFIMATTSIYRTPSAGDLNKWTMSFWVKRASIGGHHHLASAVTGGDNTVMKISNDDVLYFEEYQSSAVGYLKTNRLFRDLGAWYHIVFVWDTDNVTPGDRMILYVNGVRETSFSTETYPGSGQDSLWNSAMQNTIGEKGSAGYFDGSMSHIHFCDGYAYAASDFGQTDSTSGIWKIKTSPSVSYGTNGFFLKMEDRTNLDLDSSPNAHTFTTGGTLTATYDNPSNNFCTMNPLQNEIPNATFTHGNNTIKN